MEGGVKGRLLLSQSLAALKWRLCSAYAIATVKKDVRNSFLLATQKANTREEQGPRVIATRHKMPPWFELFAILPLSCSRGKPRPFAYLENFCNVVNNFSSVLRIRRPRESRS